MPAITELSKAALSVEAIIDKEGEIQLLTENGFRKASKLNITLTDPATGTGGEGGTGGPITLADGADATTGTKADPVAVDPTAENSLVSLTKAQAVATLNVSKSVGSKAPGVAAETSLLTGGVFLTAAPTLTSGQQAASSLDNKANVNVRLRGTGVVGVDNMPNNIALVSGENDGGQGGSRLLGTGSFGLNKDGTWGRVKLSPKGTYTSPAAPETMANAAAAQLVSGTSIGSATTIATIDNAELLYRKVCVHIKNNTSTVLTDLIIEARCNPADPNGYYDVIFSASDDYDDPAGPLVMRTINPLTLASGQTTLLVLDISVFSSIRLRACVASGTTNVDVRWFGVGVVGI